MAVTKHGYQYYDDDPHQRVFRVIYPTHDDAELDQPPTDGYGNAYLREDGTPHSWSSFCNDAARVSVVDKVDRANPPKRLFGTPGTAKDEPVIYWVNSAAVLSASTEAQRQQVDDWVAAHPDWSNKFIDLGNGDVASLTAACVAPCWIVIVGGGVPAIGGLQKTTTFAGQTVALWVA
jgi:hypothetical protein